MLSPLFPHNGSRWQGFTLPAAERRAWPCLAVPEFSVQPRRSPFLHASHRAHGKPPPRSFPGGAAALPALPLPWSRAPQPAGARSRMLQGKDGARSCSRAGCTWSPARWAAIRQFPAALGFPLLSKKFMRNSWLVAQPVLPALPSRHPVLPHTSGNSPLLLGKGSAACTAALAAERRASSTGRAVREPASPRQSSSCARSRSALPLPTQAALTLPCHSGGVGAGRFGNSLRAETRRFGRLAG